MEWAASVSVACSRNAVAECGRGGLAQGAENRAAAHKQREAELHYLANCGRRNLGQMAALMLLAVAMLLLIIAAHLVGRVGGVGWLFWLALMVAALVSIGQKHWFVFKTPNCGRYHTNPSSD